MPTSARLAWIVTWVLLLVSVGPLLQTPYGIPNVVFYVCVLAGLRGGNGWSASAAALVTAVNGTVDTTSLWETGGPVVALAVAPLFYSIAVAIYLRAASAMSRTRGRGWLLYAVPYSLVSILTLVLFQNYTVLNHDMADTLLLGDFVLVSRWSPTYVLKDDVLALRLGNAPGVTFGRVVEQPGDLVQPETYVISTDDQGGEPSHRLLVEPTKVIGQVVWIYWSIDVPDPETARWYQLLWTNTTRWSRMFRVVR